MTSEKATESPRLLAWEWTQPPVISRFVHISHTLVSHLIFRFFVPHCESDEKWNEGKAQRGTLKLKAAEGFESITLQMTLSCSFHLNVLSLTSA